MNTYEAFVILKPILDVDNSDNVLKIIENAVENLGGKIVRKEKQGRKRLAYEINKFKDGFVTTYLLQLPPSAIVSFRRTCRLNSEDILRVGLVNRNKVDITDATVYGRDRSSERGERGDRDRGDRGDRDRGERGDRGDRGDRGEYRGRQAARPAE